MISDFFLIAPTQACCPLTDGPRSRSARATTTAYVNCPTLHLVTPQPTWKGGLS